MKLIFMGYAKMCYFSVNTARNLAPKMNHNAMTTNQTAYWTEFSHISIDI